ncbi:MAG: M16 family metallopeptidase [Thermoanaerobaculia bacterium]
MSHWSPGPFPGAVRLVWVLIAVLAWPATAALRDTDRLPLDPAVRTGRLANGLTWFVRKNARPEKRAELWLAVNAGSVLEDEDQRGLAHFVEHMAFRGTKNFPDLEIINFMERIGMKFGPDVNATTNFDETVYMLKVPTDDAAAVKKALAILADWAGNVTFDGPTIDKERGVVVEEWRLGRGAEARMRDRQLPILLKGSRYAERLPIGKKEVIETAPYDALRRFYRDWYRPDLMAVIAVGDLDPAAMEASIRSQFASLKNPENPRPRVSPPVPGHDETLVSVATDPEATSTRVAVLTEIPKRPQATVGDYRREVVEELYHSMLNDRLAELRRNPDPPFLSARSDSQSLVRTRDVVSQSARVDQNGLARGLDTLLVELARVDKHGFLDTELERAKGEMLRYYESAYAERAKEESSDYAGEISQLFLSGDPMPGIEISLDLVRRFLPAIALEGVNRVPREWSAEKSRVVLVNGPARIAATLPTEAKLLETLHASRDKSVDPWVDRVKNAPLVPEPPTPGTVSTAADIPELSVTRWVLSNGLTVLLKPTEFKDDEILLSGFARGGSSLLPDDDYVSANFAGQVLSEGGLGAFDRIELGKALSGKIAQALGSVGELEESIRGGASPRDVETMFQLAYLTFTAPRADEKAFAAWKTRMKAALENRLARPESVFGDRMQVTLSQGHFRRRPLSAALLDEIDLRKAEVIWRDRFADASQFTFVLVGTFKVDEIRPLVLRWLGGLPSRGRKETWKDIGVRLPKGEVAVDVKKGLEPKSLVQLVFTGEAPWSREAQHLLSALGSALRIRLREVLREDLGGVYGVGAGGGISRFPAGQSFISISFGCAPDRVPELKKAVLDLIATVKKDGFSAEVVGKVKEQETRDNETRLKENGFWIGYLLSAERYQEDPKLILKYADLVNLVTSDALRDTARRHLDPQQLVVGILMPEGAPAAAPSAKQ